MPTATLHIHFLSRNSAMETGGKNVLTADIHYHYHQRHTLTAVCVPREEGCLSICVYVATHEVN